MRLREYVVHQSADRALLLTTSHWLDRADPPARFPGTGLQRPAKRRSLRGTSGGAQFSDDRGRPDHLFHRWRPVVRA